MGDDLEEFESFCNEPQEVLVEFIEDALSSLTCDNDVYCAINALKKKLGMPYETPNAMTKKEAQEFGVPQDIISNMLEVKA